MRKKEVDNYNLDLFNGKISDEGNTIPGSTIDTDRKTGTFILKRVL